jgi:hypothetical protein
MARERPDTPDTTVTDPPAKPRARRTTRVTPTAPLGRPSVEPIVEQVVEEGGSTDVAVPVEEMLADVEWLYDQVQHAIGCPMASAGYDPQGGEPGRGQRMEWHDATQPRTDQNPVPHRYRIIACLECGRRARIDLGAQV